MPSPAPHPTDTSQRSPSFRPGARNRLPPGASLLGLGTLVTAATIALTYPAANTIYCDRLAPLCVLAALAAVLIALCFRGLATHANRRVAGVALLLASVSLFASVRFVARYHAACTLVEQRLQQLKTTR